MEPISINGGLEERIELVFSDVHQFEAADGIYELAAEIKSDNPGAPLRAILNGDITAHPVNDYLRSIKKEAVAAGGDHVKAEEEAWLNHILRTTLVKEYRLGYDASIAILRRIEDLNRLVSGKIISLEGNDNDRLRRIMKAEYYWANEHDTLPRADLGDVIAASPFFRHMERVEFDIFGRAIFIRIPYIENKGQEVLDSYKGQVARALRTEAVQRSVDQVVIVSHTSPDKVFRSEARNEWYLEIYDLIWKYLPHVFREKRVAQISGHTHYTPDPYLFEGVKLFPMGFGDSREIIPEKGLRHYRGKPQEHIQRSLFYNPEDPLGTIAIKDIKLPIK